MKFSKQDAKDLIEVYIWCYANSFFTRPTKSSAVVKSDELDADSLVRCLSNLCIKSKKTKQEKMEATRQMKLAAKMIISGADDDKDLLALLQKMNSENKARTELFHLLREKLNQEQSVFKHVNNAVEFLESYKKAFEKSETELLIKSLLFSVGNTIYAQLYRSGSFYFCAQSKFLKEIDFIFKISDWEKNGFRVYRYLTALAQYAPEGKLIYQKSLSLFRKLNEDYGMDFKLDMNETKEEWKNLILFSICIDKIAPTVADIVNKTVFMDTCEAIFLSSTAEFNRDFGNIQQTELMMTVEPLGGSPSHKLLELRNFKEILLTKGDVRSSMTTNVSTKDGNEPETINVTKEFLAGYVKNKAREFPSCEYALTALNYLNAFNLVQGQIGTSTPESTRVKDMVSWAIFTIFDCAEKVDLIIECEERVALEEKIINDEWKTFRDSERLMMHLLLLKDVEFPWIAEFACIELEMKNQMRTKSSKAMIFGNKSV